MVLTTLPPKSYTTRMDTVTELQFTADVKSWIDAILKERSDLPFSRAEVESRPKGKLIRHDLVLYGQHGEKLLTGEVKLPDKVDGRTPYNEALVADAHGKADDEGVDYFFTWNVNRFVLWRTFKPRTPIAERDLEHHDITLIRESREVYNPRVQQEIKKFWEDFLKHYAGILRGVDVVRTRPLDEAFIKILEAALDAPITHTLAEINKRFEKEKKFERALNAWMRDSQGWTLSNVEEVLRDNLERAAKFSCYVLVNKIVFHKALKKRFPKLRRMKVPISPITAAQLNSYLSNCFEEAKQVTHDYETVFDGDFGDTLPFLSDGGAEAWRELLEHIDGFDFTQINYEIIGHIFERLISPDERHRYGQHYTMSEVVDLIESFCLRDSSASVFDPACGGGTFLVRAYARKKWLSKGRLSHSENINNLYGVDISAYPVHLTILNLATRDLIDRENYPRVARSDFFDTRPDKPIIHVPFGAKGQTRMLPIPPVDMVVGNPPYIRQEDIGKDRKKELLRVVQATFPEIKLSGRSDIHVYFWPHAASYLKPGGYFGFLTSSSWLDTDYGFKLQKFLLENYQIIAIFESNVEPWFTGARITTAATILRREPDRSKRMANKVRFVQLRKPLRDILVVQGEGRERFEVFDELRDKVESAKKDSDNDFWRIRLVSQQELWDLGCRLGVLEVEENGENNDVGVQEVHEQAARYEVKEYKGWKWGIYLRAPKVFFELMDEFKDSFVPLGEIAEVRFGVKSGADDFFYVRDITEEALNKEKTEAAFREHYGIPRKATAAIRIAQSGDGSVHRLETRYLEPIVHSLMEIDSVELNPENFKYKTVWVSGMIDPKVAPHLRKYVSWGEREGYHEGPTCQGRVSDKRHWLDLTTDRRGAMFWSKSQQYRHIVPLNRNFICNCNLYDVWPKEKINDIVLCAVLNSTLVALSKHLFGRYMGREGNLKTEIVDVNMMLVPDPRGASSETKQKFLNAFSLMQKRKSQPLVEEFELQDRQELDDAVLEMIGVKKKQERRELRARLYEAMTALYREIREVELQVQKNRLAQARRGRTTPRSLAEEIWAGYDKSKIMIFPEDFIPKYTPFEMIELPAGPGKVLNDLFTPPSLKVGSVIIPLQDVERVHFAKAALDAGRSGPVPIPHDPGICKNVLSRYRTYLAEREHEFSELSGEFTADEAIHEKVVRELFRLSRKMP